MWAVAYHHNVHHSVYSCCCGPTVSCCCTGYNNQHKKKAKMIINPRTQTAAQKFNTDILPFQQGLSRIQKGRDSPKKFEKQLSWIIRRPQSSTVHIRWFHRCNRFRRIRCPYKCTGSRWSRLCTSRCSGKDSRDNRQCWRIHRMGFRWIQSGKRIRVSQPLVCRRIANGTGRFTLRQSLASVWQRDPLNPGRHKHLIPLPC